MTAAGLRRRIFAVVAAGATSLTLATTSAVLVAPPAEAATTVVVSPLPAKTYSLSSYYGPRCMPTVGASTWHAGQDMSAARGVPINAIADGVVVRAGATSGFGQWVVLRHSISGRTVSSLYGHVVDGDQYVRVGQTVRAGQRIADVGSSGTSTGPHLHLEIYHGAYGSGATHTDPLTFLNGAGVDLAASATRVATRSVPTSCTYYTQSEANLRSQPSTSASVLVAAPRGSTLTGKPGAGSGTWREVRYGTRTGWISASLIGPHRPAVTATPVSSTVQVRYVTSATLNLRSRPSTSSTVLTVLARGTAVTHAASPSKVAVGGRTGYVSTAFLSTTRPPAPAVQAPKVSYVASSTLNLRSRPSTSSTVLTVLARGTAVTHAASPSNGWVKVTVGGRTGYVSTAFLSTTRPR
jgi:uncharacterized protein YgiM (DUF1202 family)